MFGSIGIDADRILNFHSSVRRSILIDTTHAEVQRVVVDNRIVNLRLVAQNHEHPIVLHAQRFSTARFFGRNRQLQRARH